MIKLAEDIDGYDGRKVPIDPSWQKMLIEIASNQQIDIAIVDAEKAKRFEKAESFEEVEKLQIDWLYESTRQEDFPYEQSKTTKAPNYLIFYNANTEDTAIVAYKFTQLSGPTK